MKPPGPFLEVLSGSVEPDPELDSLLFAARESAEPTSENRERVSLALRSALPASHLPDAAAAGPSSSGAFGRASTELPGPLAAARHGGTQSSRWLLLGGLVLGALGFWMGRDLGYAQGLARGLEQRLASDVGSASTQSAHAVPVAELDAPAPVDPAPPPAPVAAEPRLEPDAAPARRHAPPLRAGAAAPRGKARIEAPATAVEPVASLSFREALEQLRRAQQQLHNGQAAMSLLVLSELDRNAGELLREERETTRVLALCSAGQEKAARAAAEALRQESPRSIYAMRLEQSCISDAADSEAIESAASEPGGAF